LRKGSDAPIDHTVAQSWLNSPRPSVTIAIARHGRPLFLTSCGLGAPARNNEIDQATNQEAKSNCEAKKENQPIDQKA
jgi:hypothetical protein